MHQPQDFGGAQGMRGGDGALSPGAHAMAGGPSAGGYGGGDMFSSAQPIGQLGLNMSKGFVSSTIATYTPFLAAFWHALKYYFDINNRYVLNKLKLCLVPFVHKKWDRATTDESGGGMRHECASPGLPSHAPPVHDINAPDLYIPVMSFVTYVLLVGLLKGTTSEFTPEVLSEVTSACLVTQVLEVGLIKLGMYLQVSSSASVPMLDLVAYTSYKYLALVVNLVFGILLGSTAYTIAQVYTGLALTFFTFKVMSHVVPDEARSNSQTPSRNYFLFGTSCLQFLLIWWLGYSGEA